VTRATCINAAASPAEWSRRLVTDAIIAATYLLRINTMRCTT
jgi:hypothetical protein